MYIIILFNAETDSSEFFYARKSFSVKCILYNYIVIVTLLLKKRNNQKTKMCK